MLWPFLAVVHNDVLPRISGDEYHDLDTMIATKYGLSSCNIYRRNSLINQEIIQRNAEWNYAGVFADEALTGTRDSRPEFQRLIADCKAAKAILCDCKAIDAELAELGREIEVVSDLSRKVIREIGHSAEGPDEQRQRSEGYLERHRLATDRVTELERMKRQRKSRARILETFISGITAGPQILTEFDEKLWITTVDQVTVTLEDRFVFRFKDGTEIEG